MGVRRLDALVISHADKDHEGGAASVLAALPVALLKTSLPFEHPLSAQPVRHELCVDGDAWEWDGVRFEMLHPGSEPLSRKSTTSVACCAVRRRSLDAADLGHRSRLRAGPAGSLWPALAADAMTAPHHGSKTSSTPEFLAAVAARDVIFPVGYRNRFGHPKDEVVARYVASGRTHCTAAIATARCACCWRRRVWPCATSVPSVGAIGTAPRL
jgi:competence protein ComEC